MPPQSLALRSWAPSLGGRPLPSPARLSARVALRARCALAEAHVGSVAPQALDFEGERRDTRLRAQAICRDRPSHARQRRLRDDGRQLHPVANISAQPAQKRPRRLSVGWHSLKTIAGDSTIRRRARQGFGHLSFGQTMRRKAPCFTSRRWKSIASLAPPFARAAQISCAPRASLDVIWPGPAREAIKRLLQPG